MVILGGGDAGNTVAFDLARDDRFHVTLVDPKNYFEDVTAQPMLLCNPGTATEGRWCGYVFSFPNQHTVFTALYGVQDLPFPIPDIHAARKTDTLFYLSEARCARTEP